MTLRIQAMLALISAAERLSRLSAPTFILAGFCLLLLRAWPRLFGPEVWNEDGTRNLLEYLQSGVTSIFTPVNGYLILVPKLITAVSASVSFVHYPLVSTAFAWLVIISVFLVISMAPSRLSGGLLLAGASMLVPSDAEVFGLPLYTFWWTALLLLFVTFWGYESNDWKTRFGIVVLGSLSSPVCVVALPLFWFRAWINRGNPIELPLALLASGCTALQMIAMSFDARTTTFKLVGLEDLVGKFFGSYVIGNLASNFSFVAGVPLIALLGIALARAARSPENWSLAYLLAASIAMSVSVAPIDSLHHESAGPRYFFLPFTIISWSLVQIALTERAQFMRLAATFFLAASVVNLVPVLYRTHAPLHWDRHVYSCTKFEIYSLPVHSDGNEGRKWSLGVPGKVCAERAGPHFLAQYRGVVYPYREVERLEPPIVASESFVTVRLSDVDAALDLAGTDSQRSRLDGMAVLGSYANSDTDIGSITVNMRRMDRVLYRSGPTGGRQVLQVEGAEFPPVVLPVRLEWTVIEFSNVNLPERFRVRFVDTGTDWGEWFAIAVKK